MQKSNRNKKQISSPSVVSTDCSQVKSFYLTLSRLFGTHSKSLACAAPVNPIPAKVQSSVSQNTSEQNPCNQSSATNGSVSLHCMGDGRAAAEAYWTRVKQLELELNQLKHWIDMERNLRDVINSGSLSHADKYERDKASKDSMRPKLVRLINGGYLYFTNKISRPWGRLVMQVSAPTLVPSETGSDGLQVLQRMASMEANNLSRWLLESMPMDKIRSDDMEQIVAPGSANSFVETILSGAMKKIGTLALEGLSIQAGVQQERSENESDPKKRVAKGRESFVLAMLIQMRNPEEEYEAVGQLMIGLVEASVVEEENKVHIDGVHVAGIWTGLKSRLGFKGKGTMDRRKVKNEVNYMWSVSVSCSYWKCVRNPDIVFA